MKLFVYGTLRLGAPAGHLLSGCQPLGPAEVAGTLYDVGGLYPALVVGGSGSVRGEVWGGPDALLARLDEYEGVAEGLFRRVRVSAAGAECWTYVAGPLLEPRLRPGNAIPGGDWLAWDG